VVPFALVMLLASCGGGSKSSQPTVSVAGATGRAAPTAPRASSIPGGASALEKHKTKKRNGRSGSWQSSPSFPSSSSPSRNARLQELKRKAAALQRQLQRDKKKKGGGAPPALQPGATPQEVLARKVKRVCESVGIQALSRRYRVAPTAAAVATAYAASYPPTFRAAVHDGCQSAFRG
jgi:hypothetical protein